MDMKKIESKIAQGPQRRIDAIKKLEQSKEHQDFLKKQLARVVEGLGSGLQIRQ